jgi:predicted aminopeptidase
MFSPSYKPLLLTLAFLSVFIAGCSPGYVMRAAYEQSKILLSRRPIEDVINDPATSKEDVEKLALVLEARKFAEEIGLSTGGSFTKYADIGKDTLAWVVMGSRRDSFDLCTWWFPIVGTVPYKGFFDKDDADSQARKLEERGFESSVRGTEAFSTLGWFNDPILSTTLKNSASRIVNTVIHESVHSTVWIPDNVAFNESLANFVGSRAAVDFFKQRSNNFANSTVNSSPESVSLIAQAELEHRFTLDLADAVSDAFKQLEELYNRQDLSSEHKINERQRVFDRAMQPFRERYPKASTLRVLNNADLLQSTIYMTELRGFEKLYSEANGSWLEFFVRIRQIKEKLANREYAEPFAGLGRG